MLDKSKFMTENEVQKLLKFSKSNRLKSILDMRNHVIIHLLVGTGCRGSEARLLKMSDLFLSDHYLQFTRTKNGTTRTALLSPPLTKLLKRYISFKKKNYEPSGPSDYLFRSRNGGYMTIQSMENLFKKMAKAAGIRTNLTLHSTRHAVGFAVMKKTGNIRMVQEILGHKSIQSTMVYAHISEDQIQKTINALWA